MVLEGLRRIDPLVTGPMLLYQPEVSAGFTRQTASLVWGGDGEEDVGMRAFGKSSVFGK